MISKQKTTLKEYRNSKGREQLLHPRPRERMEGGKKVRRTSPTAKPTDSDPGLNSNFVGESEVVGTGKQNSKR